MLQSAWRWNLLAHPSGSHRAGLLAATQASTGSSLDDFQKAARSLTAAYLNASCGMAYAYTVDELIDMWNLTANDPDDADAAFLALHKKLDLADNYYYNPLGSCPISASGWQRTLRGSSRDSRAWPDTMNKRDPPPRHTGGGSLGVGGPASAVNESGTNKRMAALGTR